MFTNKYFQTNINRRRKNKSIKRPPKNFRKSIGVYFDKRYIWVSEELQCIRVLNPKQ